jgi:tetratricopeptide (TPR) repeat protein
MYTKIKKQYLAVGVFFLGMIFISCGKGFLEKEQVGRISKELLLSDMPGVRAALNGAYNRMAYYQVNEFGMYGDVAGDHIKENSAGTAVPPMYPEYNFSSNAGDDEFAVGHIWTYAFVALDHVNSILEAIPALKDKFPASISELDQITAQGLIMRALCHFDLCKVYGQTYQYTANASHLGVPVILKTPSPGTLVPRKTVKEVYAQVIADLKEGERLLKANPLARDPFSASYQAAWGLLSRVYLYMGEWDQSIAYADSVINKTNYTLTTSENYQNMYTSGDPGAEVIWQLYSRTFRTGTVANLFSFDAFSSDKLLLLFDGSDIRKQLFRDSSGRQVTKKFGITGKVTGTTRIPMDPKIIRLSEVYLNRAEAQWNKKNYTQASDDVRRIAERAHNNGVVTVPSDPAQLFEFICDERSRELCFEGHRLFDIARRKQDIIRGPGCNAAVCTLTYPNVRFVLPIPQKEIDANKAIQPNPGIN